MLAIAKPKQLKTKIRHPYMLASLLFFVVRLQKMANKRWRHQDGRVTYRYWIYSCVFIPIGIRRVTLKPVEKKRFEVCSDSIEIDAGYLTPLFSSLAEKIVRNK